MISKDIKSKTSLHGSFNHPEDIPADEQEAALWQSANKKFWEENSMRYDWDESIGYKEFTPEFYKEIDKRFLDAVKPIMPWKKVPFEKWMEPEKLKDKDVLEIGTGNGTHAQILSMHAKSYTGIDLTQYATQSTAKRLALFGLNGRVINMDAEHLQFEPNTFDFIWSWGVIHHSSNIEKILDGMQRVLKPGGETVVMVYYRSIWSYYIAGFLFGFFSGKIFKGKSIHDVNQDRTDGALARYYTLHSWRELVKDKFDIVKLETLGNKGDIFPLPGSRLKTFLLTLIPTWLTVFSLKDLRMGSMLICKMKKK